MAQAVAPRRRSWKDPAHWGPPSAGDIGLDNWQGRLPRCSWAVSKKVVGAGVKTPYPTWRSSSISSPNEAGGGDSSEAFTGGNSERSAIEIDAYPRLQSSSIAWAKRAEPIRRHVGQIRRRPFGAASGSKACMRRSAGAETASLGSPCDPLAQIVENDDIAGLSAQSCST